MFTFDWLEGYWPETGSAWDWALRGVLFGLALVGAGRSLQVARRPTYRPLSPVAMLVAMLGVMWVIVATTEAWPWGTPAAASPRLTAALSQGLIVLLAAGSVLGLVAVVRGAEPRSPGLRGRAMAWLALIVSFPLLGFAVARAADQYGALVAKVVEAETAEVRDWEVASGPSEGLAAGAAAQKLQELESPETSKPGAAEEVAQGLEASQGGGAEGSDADKASTGAGGMAGAGDLDEDGADEADVEGIGPGDDGWDLSSLAARPSSEAYVSKRHGFAVRLAGTDWRRWPAVRFVAPEAAVGFESGRDVGFVVIPVDLMRFEPRASSVRSSLLRFWEFDANGPGILRKRRFRQGALEGVQFAVHRESDGEDFVYLVRVGEAHGVAYMLVGWSSTDDFDDLAGAAELMDRFTFEAPEEPLRPEDLGAYESLRYGRFFNGLGLDYYQRRDFREAEAYFRQAVRCDAGDAVFVNNVVDAMTETDRYAEAAAYLEPRLERMSGEPVFWAMSGWLHGMIGEGEKAVAHYARAFEGDFADADYFADYVAVMADHEGPAAALKLLRGHRSDPVTPGMARLEAQFLGRLERHEEAVAVLTEARARARGDVDVAFDLIEAMRSAGRSRDALGIVDAMEEAGVASSALAYQRGVLQSDLGWYRKAKRSLEAAATRKPEDAAIESMLEYVSGQIGEGANWRVKAPLEPVAPPAGMWTGGPEASLTAAQGEAGYVAIRRWEGIEVDGEGTTLRRTRWAQMRVNSKSGLDRLSSLSFGFNPLGESIYINELRVLDGEGKVVTEGRVDDYYVVDQADGPMASFDKQLRAPVPGLKVGHVVEYRVTWEHQLEEGRLPLQDVALWGGVPILEAAAFYRGPRAHFRASAGPGAKEIETGEDGVRAWRAGDVPGWRWEPMQVSTMRYLPYVRFSDARVTWEGAALEYLGEIEDRLAIAPQVRALAGTLFEEDAEETTKLAAIIRHVQDSLSYQAIAFGTRGRIMPPVTKTLRNRFGDCKDHSLLMHQLLRCAGIESHLALVHTADPLDESLPSLDQFNHMVVYLPVHQGGRVVDGTDKHTGVDTVVPVAMAKQTMLVLDPDDPRLVKVPPYPKDSSRLKIRRQVERSGESDLRVQEKLEADGYYGAQLRAYFQSIEPRHRAARYQQSLTRSGQIVRVRKLAVHGLEETAKPLRVELTYVLPGAVQSVGRKLLVKLPAAFESDALFVTHVDQRLAPFNPGYPLQLDVKTALTVSEGYAWANPDAVAAEFEHPILDGEVAPKQGGGEAIVAATLQQTPRQMPAEAYPAYQKLTERVVRAIGPRIVLRPR